jgi:hypothetical protein
MAENKLHMRKISAELFPALIFAFSLMNAFAHVLHRAFYEYGFFDSYGYHSNGRDLWSHNRTLGFNLGINL